MTRLQSQEAFEALIERGKEHDPMVVVRFGASWCQACTRLDTERLLNVDKRIKWLYADIDQSDLEYCLGYCGMVKIPAMIAIKNGVPQPGLQSSDTEKVVQWLKKQFDV